MLSCVCRRRRTNCQCSEKPSVSWQDPCSIGAPMAISSAYPPDSLEPMPGPSSGAQACPLDIPPLPASAALDPSLAAGASAWLDTYVAYASSVCPMLPPCFHESAALWLASVAVARRLYVPMSGRPVYPNLFVAWIVPGSFYEATAAFALAPRPRRARLSRSPRPFAHRPPRPALPLRALYRARATLTVRAASTATSTASRTASFRPNAAGWSTT